VVKASAGAAAATYQILAGAVRLRLTGSIHAPEPAAARMASGM